MERAKRIATAFIGVAFAANYCEPAAAQSPNRFIRQPAKAPANPVPVTPVTDVPVKTLPISGVESAANNESAKPTTSEPKQKTDTEGLLSFPSLLPLTSTPDLSFDALESLATVPEVESEKLKLEAPSSKTTTQVTTPVRPNSNRSGQLQWTSRANVRPRSETYNSGSDSQPHSESNGNRSSSSFNTRTNSSVQPLSSQQDFQSAAAARQQSDSTNELLIRIANQLESREIKPDHEDEPAKKNRIRASLVSDRITSDPRFANPSLTQSTVTRIESPQGWQAIGSRLSDHVKKCESLLGRGAFCSAREEAETASMLLYRHIDLHDNLYRCEPAVQSANQALREAEDFLVALRTSTDGASLRRLVDAHETPVLKDKNLNGMSPLTAAQHYRQFAESKLVEAGQGHPWASELLYTVGRTYQAEADADSNRVDVLRMKAMAYYRASRTTLPSNAVACNQLGYLLLQMDRNTEAREVLVAAVTIKQDEAFLSNLAEASRRLNDQPTVAWATQTVAAIRQRTPPPSPVPPFVEVSQEDFIAISPREIGPKTQADSGLVPGPKSVDRSAAAPTVNQLR